MSLPAGVEICSHHPYPPWHWTLWWRCKGFKPDIGSLPEFQRQWTAKFHSFPSIGVLDLRWSKLCHDWAKMALALILRRFTFELSPSFTYAPLSILSVQPQYGAHLILHKPWDVFFKAILGVFTLMCSYQWKQLSYIIFPQLRW